MFTITNLSMFDQIISIYKHARDATGQYTEDMVDMETGELISVPVRTMTIRQFCLSDLFRDKVQQIRALAPIVNKYKGVDMASIAANEGDEKAIELYNAFIYQVCKNIGSQAAVLEGKVDQIVVTGGIAYSKLVIAEFTRRIGWIAPLTVYPGEDELLALAQGALRVLNGEEKAMEY